MKKINIREEIRKYRSAKNVYNFICGMCAGAILVFLIQSGLKLYYENTYGVAFPDGKFMAIADAVEKNYVGDYDKKQLAEGAYAGMLSSLGDKYTSYFTKEEFQKLMEGTKGVYQGIGMYLSFNDESKRAVVNGIFPNSPVSRTDIAAGDFIISINGIKITDVESYKQSVDSIKNSDGTVEITYESASSRNRNTVCVKAEEVDIPSVKGEMLEDKIGYIIIASFDEITLNQFEETLTKLQSEGMERLIIDLRDNPGGLMKTVVPITDKFIPKGFVTYTEDKKGNKKYEYSDEDMLGIPLVLLVNGRSASASEVMSGAIKDTGVGKLVGTKTYGKGVVQNIMSFHDGSGFKITTSRYYTPSGKCINGIGIEPDYEVEYNAPAEGEKYSKETDNQLQKAIEVVKGMK